MVEAPASFSFSFPGSQLRGQKGPQRDAREMTSVSACGQMSMAIGKELVTHSFPAKWEMKLLMAGAFTSTISKTPVDPQPGISVASCLASSCFIS